MEVAANNCIGPLKTRSHFKHILAPVIRTDDTIVVKYKHFTKDNKASTKWQSICVQLFCRQCCFGLAQLPLIHVGFRGLLMSLPHNESQLEDHRGGVGPLLIGRGHHEGYHSSRRVQGTM